MEVGLGGQCGNQAWVLTIKKFELTMQLFIHEVDVLNAYMDDGLV